MAEARDALRWLADPEVGNHSSVVGDFALEVVDACHAVAEFRCDCPVHEQLPVVQVILVIQLDVAPG